MQQAASNRAPVAAGGAADAAARVAPKIDLPAKIVDNADFTMKLIVPKQWRLSMGISHDDVWRVGLRAVATFESSLPVVTAVSVCDKCAKKRSKFLDVAVSSRDVFGPAVLSADVECFSFDRCRAHCSSSRLHMRSRLVVAMQFNDYTTVFSDAFVTTARAGRGMKPYDAPSAPAAVPPPLSAQSRCHPSPMAQMLGAAASSSAACTPLAPPSCAQPAAQAQPLASVPLLPPASSLIAETAALQPQQQRPAVPALFMPLGVPPMMQMMQMPLQLPPAAL